MSLQPLSKVAPNETIHAKKEEALQILIASADTITARITKFLLEDVGYAARLAEDEHRVRQLLKQGDLNLVLLDEICPECGGFSLCNEIRAQFHTPIIFLSNENRVADRIRALKLGADDIVGKPYNPTELLARIEAVMRRYGDEFLKVYSTYEALTVGPLHLDPVQRRVLIRDKREENLTEREFQLLYCLVQNARCVLTSHQLLQKIWGIEDAIDSNLVPVYIGRLRRKIEADPLKPAHIVRVRDMGYSYQP